MLYLEVGFIGGMSIEINHYIIFGERNNVSTNN